MRWITTFLVGITLFNTGYGATPKLINLDSDNAEEVISSLKFPMHHLQRPLTFFVEGNIGAGKTTLLDSFKAYHPFMDIIPEPVDQWTNLNGTDMLGLLFIDPERWGATQESLAMYTFIKQHLRRYGLVKGMERSVFSARICFVEALRLTGKLTAAEYTVLDGWFRFLTNNTEQSPSGFDVNADFIIYLQTSPEESWSRIKSRGRPEESPLKMNYLQQLHRLHEDWLIHGNTSVPDAYVPAEAVLVINTAQPYVLMKRVYEMLANKVWESIPEEMKVECENHRTT